MDIPSDRNDLHKWAEFFIITRRDVLEKTGEDIAEDKETMFGWFVNMYMNGHDEARVAQMFAEAGVKDIEGYLKTLE